MQEPVTSEKKERSNFFRFFVVTFAVSIAIRIFVAQPFIVNGASMEPTFLSGEYLIIDELTYTLFREPERGEVVVFRYPKDTGKFFIKRIIGLPGETVRIRSNAVYILDGKTTFKLDEPYIEKESLSNYEKVLAEGEYFVMGDNRNVSSDSRAWGPVPEKLIIGRALFRFLPLSDMEIFPGENTSVKEAK